MRSSTPLADRVLLIGMMGAGKSTVGTALADALSIDDVAVSVAGGAVLDPDNRALIRDAGLVVWLRAEVATLAERVGDGAGRPLLGDDPSGALARLYAERRPLYEQLADVVVDVDGRAVADIVEQIVDEIAGRVR